MWQFYEKERLKPYGGLIWREGIIGTRDDGGKGNGAAVQVGHITLGGSLHVTTACSLPMLVLCLSLCLAGAVSRIPQAAFFPAVPALSIHTTHYAQCPSANKFIDRLPPRPAS